jgi:hypothetical protein
MPQYIDRRRKHGNDWIVNGLRAKEAMVINLLYLAI